MGSSWARHSASVLLTLSVMMVFPNESVEKRSRRTANFEMGRPVRRQRGIGFAAGLLVEWLFEHGEQLAHAGIIAVLRLFDRLLGQIVSQHVLRIDAVHGGAAGDVVAAFLR